MCKTIKQKVVFKTSPQFVYKMLASSESQTQWSGKKAKISKKTGGVFSLYNGDFTGLNVELVPGKRIVQAWRSKEFPEGIFSMVTFNLVSRKATSTELILTHRGVPKELIPGIEEVWRKLYWDKMRKALKD